MTAGAEVVEDYSHVGMLAVRGRVQREGEVVHLVARHVTDLYADLTKRWPA